MRTILTSACMLCTGDVLRCLVSSYLCGTNHIFSWMVVLGVVYVCRSYGIRQGTSDVSNAEACVCCKVLVI